MAAISRYVAQHSNAMPANVRVRRSVTNLTMELSLNLELFFTVFCGFFGAGASAGLDAA